MQVIIGHSCVNSARRKDHADITKQLYKESDFDRSTIGETRWVSKKVLISGTETLPIRKAK